ncbi:MAG: glutathione S-transferase [Caulobacterales bacterium 32-69-10]|nr:MAG: glutathione S-transferase [Caulobacterales bacterium 32-69-10]
MLRILGRPTSINVRKVLWTADEIGLSYDHEPEWATPATPSGSPALLKLNPNGLVPVIEDENGPMWESNTISRYLAGRHGRADLLPAEPLARARVEQWMDWQATDLNVAFRYGFRALIRKDAGFDDPQQIGQSLQACAARLGLIAGQLEATGAHMAGPDFTLADIGIALSVHRIRSLPGAPALPTAVAAYMQRLAQRPAYARHCGPETP